MLSVPLECEVRWSWSVLIFIGVDGLTVDVDAEPDAGDVGDTGELAPRSPCFWLSTRTRIFSWFELGVRLADTE